MRRTISVIMLSMSILLLLHTPYQLSAQNKLTDEQLIGEINKQPAISFGKLNLILENNYPLSDTVLKSVINRVPALPSGILKNILIDNSPLSNRIFASLLKLDTPLPEGIFNNILEAQPCNEVTSMFAFGDTIHGDPLKVGEYVPFYNKGTSEDDVLYYWVFSSDSSVVNTSYLENPEIKFDFSGIKSINLYTIRYGCVAFHSAITEVQDTSPIFNDSIDIRFDNIMNTILLGVLDLSLDSQFYNLVYEEANKELVDDDYKVLFSTLEQKYETFITSVPTKSLLSTSKLAIAMKNSIANNGGSYSQQELIGCSMNSFDFGKWNIKPGLLIPNLNFADPIIPPIIAIGVESKQSPWMKRKIGKTGYQYQNGTFRTVFLNDATLSSANIWLISVDVDDTPPPFFVHIGARCWCNYEQHNVENEDGNVVLQRTADCLSRVEEVNLPYVYTRFSRCGRTDRNGNCRDSGDCWTILFDIVNGNISQSAQASQDPLIKTNSGTLKIIHFTQPSLKDPNISNVLKLNY